MSGLAIEVKDLSVARGGKPVLHAVSLTVPAGEVTALVGANGAGKSTLVMAMAGMLRPEAGVVTLGGKALSGLPPEAVRRRGVAIVPEGDHVLAGLSVRDNLQAAGSMLSRQELAREIERALTLFPELKDRLPVAGRSLSGGQKQMLSIAQALIARPAFLLIDELSFGLAPAVIARLTGALEQITAEGAGILLIEQFTSLALSISAGAYVLERGRVVFAGSAAELRSRPEILHSAYLAS